MGEGVFPSDENRAMKTLERLGRLLENDATIAIGACSYGRLDQGSNAGKILAETLLKTNPDSRAKIYTNQDNSIPYFEDSKNVINVKINYPITTTHYFNRGWLLTELDGSGSCLPAIETGNNLLLGQSGKITEVNRREFILKSLELGKDFGRLPEEVEKYYQKELNK